MVKATNAATNCNNNYKNNNNNYSNYNYDLMATVAEAY